MEIREAEHGEEQKLAEEFRIPLAREMEEYSELNHLEENPLESVTESFREILEKENQIPFILEIDGEEVGYMLLKKGEKSSRKHNEYLAVIDLFVKEGYRNNGYGTALIEKAEKIAEQEDRDYLMISAEWDNEAAQKLYRNQEFEEKKVTFTKKLD